MKNLQIKQIDIVILINIALIILFLFIFNKSNVDLEFQNMFFDFENRIWVIDRFEPIKRFWFYNLPKILLGICIFIALVNLILKLVRKNQNIKPLLIFFLGITLIPLTVGNIKKFTNIYCPNQLEIYDGSNPYSKIFEPYPENFHPKKYGQCFPAGHAVTGFCLMILFFTFQKESLKILGLLLGIALGWILGFYQMAKGSHFLSDTIIAMFCSFLFAAIIYKLVNENLKN